MSGLPPIERLVPHRPPMLLLDAVERWDDPTVVCRAHIERASLFERDGVVRAAVLLEHMAQTVAALAGLHARAAGQAPRIGVLVAVRSLELEVDVLRPGDALRISARREAGDDDLGRFRAEVERDGVVIARAELTVLRPAEERT